MEYQQLLTGNKRFVEEKLRSDPDFFKDLSKGQTPEYLWIGCSDSRVPDNEITQTQPGEIFVHRNIANLVINTDINLLSVLHYSVTYLKVKHIIVVGHYGCGGVMAAMSNKKYGFIDNWLSHIKDVFKAHETDLLAIEDKKERSDRLVEFNVIDQVRNLAKVSVIQEAWKDSKYPQVHGWVYDMEHGILKDLDVSIDEQDDLNPIYKFDI
ncbi:MAG TPA: carbonic anhydrase [Cytophagaceae bacterium]|jgi:carbonic anhydrase|nr:carbonic anhydrase [Cytophagaceae bacterium]